MAVSFSSTSDSRDKEPVVNMKTSSIILLGLVVLANFTTLSFCKPTPLNAEQAQDVAPAGRIVYDARRLWNEAKKAHKKIYQHLDREARQAGSSDEVDQSENEEDIYKYLEQRSNATGRRYMLDLYKKIRNSSLNTPLTQANTIKSLTYFPGRKKMKKLLVHLLNYDIKTEFHWV